MITLTNPPQVLSSLGGSAKISYDKLDLTYINFEVWNKNISGQCQLSSSADASATPIQGTFQIQTNGGPMQLVLTFPNIPFFRTIALTAAQAATVQGWVTSAQNNVEGGMVSVGAVTGTQATGF